MSIADFFFGRKQNSTNSRRSVKLNRNAVRTRTLSMEPLETRDLLSVTTGSVSYYNDIVAEYPEFNLPTNQDDINIITVDLDEGASELKLEDLKTAITEAGTTTQPDLILVKTSASANSVTYTSKSDEIYISINASQYGSVTIIGWGEEKFTLDANQQCRVMTVSDSSTVVNLGGLIITNGNSSTSMSNNSSGGGIYNDSGTLVVTNSAICGNTAEYGGGIYSSGMLTVTNSTISGNLAIRSSNYNSSGGGIYINSGELTVINSTISGNTASYYGGGISNYKGIVTVTNSTISGNTTSSSSSDGGGIYSSGTLTVNNSTIFGNTASGGGGGICIFSGTLTITNSTISGNVASSGGGIYNYHGTFTVTNSTISGNIAKYRGGGIFSDIGTITNSIVSRNYGGNIYGNLSSYSSNNLIGGYCPGFVCALLFDSDGKLTNANTIDLHLRSDSIAIDQGDNAVIENIEKDINGNARIYGEIVDLGAFEYQGDRNDEPIPYSMVVNTLNDSFDLDDCEWSLREAIYYAPGYVTITFADELEGTIYLTLGQLDIEAPLAVDGDNRITIDAVQKSRVFYISSDTKEVPVVLNGLTIQNGKAKNGGGIYNDGILTVTNSTISGNTTSGTYDTHGGGIYSTGSLSVTNCTISGNTAIGFTNYKSSGGGIFNDYGTVMVTNSTISGNTAYYGNGGGISNSGTFTVINSIVSDNLASYTYGGGIYNSGNLMVTNSTISVNTAYSSGGGIYNTGSNPTANLCNTIVACNSAGNGADVYKSDGIINAYNSVSTYTEWDDGTDNIEYDSNEPLFVDAENGDYHLVKDSQSIDKGNNAYAVDADGVALAYDLDGTPRIENDTVDIGAYEYNSCTTLPIPKTSIFIKYSTQVFGVNIYPVDNATGYLIEYSLYEDFSDSVIIDAQVGENELVAFQKPQSCYWRIKTLGDNLNYLDSDYSAIRSISLNVPLRDILLSTNTPEVGTVIRATLNPADATAEYQWYCGETLIQGASDSTFTVTADQIGQTITCVATGINGYNNTVSATTESVPAITLDTPVIFPLKTYNNTIVVANWSSVDNANSYMFEYQRDDADKWTAISGLQNTSASFIGELGQTYNVRIKAIGTGIYTDSTYSQVQTVTIADTLDAQNDFIKTMLNSPVVIDYRANDEATDWSVVTVQFGEASHGEYVVNEDGTLSYTPENGFFGTDTIGYALFSPSGKASVGSISISVGLPIATSVQKTSSSHSPSTAMAPSVDSLTDWDNCCIELWAQGVNELNSGETTVTLEYNPAVYEVPYFSACPEGVALAASEGVVLPNGNVEIQLTVQVLEPIESLTDNLFLGTVVLTPSGEEGSGVEDGSNVPACVLEGVELTTSVETMSYDMNHNGAIDVNDFVAFATVFGTNLATMSPENPLYAQALKADFNKDGIVNIDDFIAFSINFGATKKRVEIPAAQARAAADSGNREWEVGNGEVIDSQVETPDAQSAAPASQLVTRNSQLESSMTLLEAYSAALLDLYDNQESFDQTDPGVVLAESRTESPVASYSDGSSQHTSFDAVDAVLEEDLLAIDWE